MSSWKVEYGRKFRERHRERERARWRRVQAKRIASGWKRKYDPLKAVANGAVNNAIAKGKLVKPSRCQDCGKEAKIQGHHTDYSKVLEVEWLCTTCHGLRHRKP